jgi:16S rRNA (guanine966-N2)-methyltransferase
MRIIAGTFRGRSLLSPPSDATRPITDRAKQSLFDALTVAVEIPGSYVLDCFAGTGSMGLETLSRGAAGVVFVERDRGALENLRNNIVRLCVIHLCRVVATDAYKVAEDPAGLRATQANFRIAFVDPPYAHLLTPQGRSKVDQLVASLAQSCMEPQGVLVLRHPDDLSLDSMQLARRVIRKFKYGSMAITWLSAQPAGPAAGE